MWLISCLLNCACHVLRIYRVENSRKVLIRTLGRRGYGDWFNVVFRQTEKCPEKRPIIRSIFSSWRSWVTSVFAIYTSIGLCLITSHILSCLTCLYLQVERKAGTEALDYGPFPQIFLKTQTNTTSITFLSSQSDLWPLSTNRFRWKGLLLHLLELRHPTHDRTPLDEGSTRVGDLYLTKHNTHNRQTDIHRAPLDEGSARRRDLYLTRHNTLKDSNL
jgi:hypothetical protein